MSFKFLALSPSEKLEVKKFIREDIRFKGMSLKDAEDLAMRLLFEGVMKGRNLFEEFINDVKLSVEKVKRGEVD